MTQEEYDSVKGIVLDLLGWGVDFKYLLEYGINKSLLYYVFNELNLRLPDNFDMSGIIAYTPEAMAEAQQASASMATPSAPKKNSPSGIGNQPKATLSSRLTTPPPPPILTQVINSPADSDLHDMERRRRQELVARKAAAQASRKSKRSDNEQAFITTASDVAKENDKNSLIPAESVDDFLNSLGPVQNLKLSISDNTHLRPPETKNDMEVDPTPEQKQPVELDQEKAIQKGTPSDRSFSEPPPPSSEAPPTSVSSTSTSFSPVTSTAFPPNAETPPPSGIPPVRRGRSPPHPTTARDSRSLAEHYSSSSHCN